MGNKTKIQFENSIERARDLFLRKHEDYGSSWTVLRISSLIDQLFIKAKRIRSIEEKKEQKVQDPIDVEFIGLINYATIGLILLIEKPEYEAELSKEQVEKWYTKHVNEAYELMEKKNHDYGEVWREMYISSFTDLILSKLLRIRQIIENKGNVSVSEGIEAGLYDIINYSVFALIKIKERNGKAYYMDI